MPFARLNLPDSAFGVFLHLPVRLDSWGSSQAYWHLGFHNYLACLSKFAHMPIPEYPPGGFIGVSESEGALSIKQGVIDPGSKQRICPPSAKVNESFC